MDLKSKRKSERGWRGREQGKGHCSKKVAKLGARSWSWAGEVGWGARRWAVARGC